MECFQWPDSGFNIKRVSEELADVIIYCRDTLDKLNLDEDEIVNDKMTKNEEKYPVSLSKGNAKKYFEIKNEDWFLKY